MKRFKNLSSEIKKISDGYQKLLVFEVANKLLKKFNQKQLKLMLTSYIELVNNGGLK